MYIPKYNAFFFHVPKAGGTSVEIFFLNDDGINVDHHELNSHLNPLQKKKYLISFRQPYFPYESQHLTCESIIDQPIWQTINYSFTVVRNPWNRVISEWHWLQQRMYRKLTLDQVIDKYIKNDGCHFIPQWKYAYVNDTLIVDDVFKLEELHIAESRLSDVFGINVQFKSYNKTQRDKDYRNYYSDKQLERLNPVLKKEAELFDYVF